MMDWFFAVLRHILDRRTYRPITRRYHAVDDDFITRLDEQIAQAAESADYTLKTGNVLNPPDDGEFPELRRRDPITSAVLGRKRGRS